MTKYLSVITFLALFFTCSREKPAVEIDNMHHYAQSRKNDLTLAIYYTAHSVRDNLSNPEGRREAVSLMQANGISKIYVEVYRAGLVVETDLLKEVVTYFQNNGFGVVGGIATVPGGDFGVRQEGPLGWLNWQDEKTQNDLRGVMEAVAPVFDTFIVDDFFCTSDTSALSKEKKGDRDWSQYRRDLLTELSTSLFIAPAKKANPDIHMIIKYPQWYDRFHLFGYELAREPDLFDEVWVGTETRGQYTQRFGFVQPYEGFINYRWISSIAGPKIGGAWFDHGDCDDLDFIEQAYQSVLAGAKELVMFESNSFINGHKGHHQLKIKFPQLADLASVVARHPVVGVAGYKPVNSDAGGDLYVMDYIGMFGIPLVPVSTYPTDEKVIFLPTQAATDKDIFQKIQKSLEGGAKIIMTTGFLSGADQGEKLAEQAGIDWPITLSTIKAEQVQVNGESDSLSIPLDLAAAMASPVENSLLQALSGEETVPFFTVNKEKNMYVLNSHTFSQADFDAVGEVLLSPRQLGLLEIPREWANTLRAAFNQHTGLTLDAPARVTMQPMGDGGIVLHNYNREEVTVNLETREKAAFTDSFKEQEVTKDGEKNVVTMKARSRVWLR